MDTFNKYLENLKKNITKRQEFNRQILMTLKYDEFFNHLLDHHNIVIDFFEQVGEKIEACPQLRFGQIITNDIFWDYRDADPSHVTVHCMDYLFGDCYCDPFYEEPNETYKRLIRKYS